ncbi:hypothetical protein ACPPVO_24485 [Dactylosporangium sp. McL0621]|uniref:hypothetical protein n=1 Tax=Dactylosporangium sp. McL0621 TaxID=3415678 RepID=UPI003CF9153D
MTGINLAPRHAAELTELLESLNAWLTIDHHHLNASLISYVGHPATTSTGSKPTSPGSSFLLGGDTDGQLFQPPPTRWPAPHRDQPHQTLDKDYLRNADESAVGTAGGGGWLILRV